MWRKKNGGWQPPRMNYVQGHNLEVNPISMAQA